MNERTTPPDNRPLTPLAQQILVALAAGARHGYAVLREVEERSHGTVVVRSGTLYVAIQRLVDEGLVEETDPPREPGIDARRRYYRLTEPGRTALELEVSRIERLARDARRRLRLHGAPP